MPRMAGMMLADSMIAPLAVPMERFGSGTTWIPDAAPLPSRRLQASGWDLMFHGFAFGEFDSQQGRRGGTQWGALNWGMLMASRDLAGGRLQARTMLSLDAAGVRDGGYPLLLQSGETWQGVPLRDRQHPHDFWMEVGAQYDRAITRELGISLYLAPSGEPALGPVAFMHRPSAMDNPTAPLGHHWQDATHVSFGVATVGVFGGRWKLEASAFNAREPNENRWDLEGMAFDSYSARLTVNPDAHWSVATGYGFLKNPEGDSQPSEHRITGSVLHGQRLGDAGQWASTLVFGANFEAGHPEGHKSALVESEAVLDSRNTLFMRSEWVEKTAADLSVPVTSSTSAGRTFELFSFGAGYVREIASSRVATLGAGASLTMNLVPTALEPAYGSRSPIGLMVFVRIRPIGANSDGMAGMRMP